MRRSTASAPSGRCLLEEAELLVHGADERVKAADIEYAATFFRDIAVEVLG